MRILFIAGLSHSGSTLLTMLLGAHSRICGVGEVEKLLEMRDREVLLADPVRGFCSCGERVASCPLWSRVFPRIDEGSSYGAKYGAFVEVAAETLGETRMLCDSSKDLGRLESISQGPNRLDIAVIHVIKDVRSYAASWRAIKRFGRIGVARCFRSWHRTNQLIERRIRQGGFPSVRVSYEELCFDPRTTLQTACRGLGIDFDEAMLDLRRSHGHVGAGNGMHTDPIKSNMLAYDFRWFSDRWISLYYHMRPDIAQYNEERVYGVLKGRYAKAKRRSVPTFLAQ